MAFRAQPSKLVLLQMQSTPAGTTTLRRMVLLVEDHPLYRLGLRTLLSQEPDFEIAGDAGNGDEALKVAQSTRIDIAIVDMLMPGRCGSDVTRDLKAAQPTCKVLGLSMVDEPIRIAEMMRAGADGFTLKSQPTSAIIAAVRTVLGGEIYFPPDLPRAVIQALTESDESWVLHRLTAREMQIFELLVLGVPNDEIAETLEISKRTVETHRQHILTKVGARSLIDLIRIGVKHGLATTVTS